MTVAALGAGAITALAGLFFLRRRQQLAKRPLGHALPALGPDARTASIALAHAASTLPAVPAVAGEPGERGETEIALGLVNHYYLYERIAERRVSACGYGPIAVACTVAEALGARHARLVRYATSGDVTGDHASVVGYAALAVV